MKQYFEIPGYPQGKARARTTKKGFSYTPEKTMLYENLIKSQFLSSCKQTYFDKEPLEIYITALYPIIKSTTKKDRKLIAEGKLLPTKKPDVDNIAKVICDALNGVAYGDDTQIVKMVVNKAYTEAEPKVIVYLDYFKGGV